MAEGRSKIRPETHLILDQPALKLPYELLRKNFKVAQTAVDRDSTAVKDGLKKVATAAVTQSATPDEILKTLDSMVARMQGLKRKLEACAEEDEKLRQHSLARIDHLSELYTIPSLEDVKYEKWSRVRLNRLLADYLLRNGHCKTAEALAKAKGIEKLVDTTAFLRMNDVKESLREMKVTEALAWCAENKKELRKADNKFEFMLRIQQYVEIVRTKDCDKIVREAIPHMKKYIMPMKDKYPEEIAHLAGLIAYPPDTKVSVYKKIYCTDRWTDLQHLFLTTHNSILSIPTKPPIHTALSAGLSALKTPLCYSKHQTHQTHPQSTLSFEVSSSAPSLLPPTHPTPLSPLPASSCPICSHELNSLAMHVPYAHHTSSHVDADAVLLPNMRVYGRRRLLEHAARAGLGKGEVKDLVTGEVFGVERFMKVFLS